MEDSLKHLSSDYTVNFEKISKISRLLDKSLPSALLTISLTNLATSGSKLQAIIDKCNKSFSKCDVILCDTLHRFNLMMDNSDITEESALLQAKTLGDEWIKSHQFALNNFKIPSKLLKWNSWLQSEHYQEKKQLIEKRFLTDISYKEAFYSTAGSYLSRRLSQDLAILSRNYQLCIEYLKEECAVMLLWAEAGYNFELYSANRNVAMGKTYEIFIEKQHPQILKHIKLNIKYNSLRKMQFANAAWNSLLKVTEGHVYVKDKYGDYVFCNDKQASSLGMPPSDIIGKSDYDISAFDKANQFRLNDEKIMKSNKLMVVEESAFYLGKDVTVLSTKVPIYNSQHDVLGVLGISVDITAQKEAEELRFKNAALQAATVEQEKFKKIELQYVRDLELARSEAQKNKLMQEFGVIASKVAHDISSPIMVANHYLNQLKKNLNTNDDESINKIQQSLLDIQNISSKILNRFREITEEESKNNLYKADDENIERYILLSALLENQISNKNIEWQSNPCNLEFQVHDMAKNTFAYIAPTEFKRSISNLLNNAYDSLGDINRSITVVLNHCHFHESRNSDNHEAKLVLTIKDTGSGIPEDKIAKVLSGESTKHQGAGIGLSGAKAYFESINGKLELKSQINMGTEIQISLPVIKYPEWLISSIKYNSSNKFAILDDSSSIIMLWQKIFEDIDINCNYFISTDDFIQWYHETNDANNIILLTDYDLGNDTATGLDVINQLQHLNSYLVTNHAEEAWLQEKIKNNNLKLLPKKMIEHIELKLI